MEYKRLYKDHEYSMVRKELKKYSLKELTDRMNRKDLARAPRLIIEDYFIEYSLEEMYRQKARRVLQAGLDSQILEICCYDYENNQNNK